MDEELQLKQVPQSLEAEQAVLEQGGVVARLVPLYGPGRCELLRRYREGLPCLPGAPGRFMNYLHRDDAVSALLLLAVQQRKFRLHADTAEIFALLALPLGLVISFGSMSRFKPLKWLTRMFVGIIRGTPLMIQLLIFYYFPGLMLKQNIWGSGEAGRFAAASIAFIINYACYFSEIYRGGIQGIPVGQEEAGLVLGMTPSQIFFRVKLMQMIKRIVPPISNEIITLVKDTSLARIIANKEIIMMAQEYASSDALIWPLFSTAIFFLIACGVLTLLLNYAEKKLSYFK